MTLDVHTLDQVLLVGAAVLLLSILAVRVSVGFGLPTLLIYLLIGVLLGRGGLRRWSSTTRRSPTPSASRR